MTSRIARHHDTRTLMRGFSLIELIITVAIIAILAAVATPIFLNQRSKASQSVAIADGNAIAKEVSTLITGYTNLGTTPVANNAWLVPTGNTINVTFSGTPTPNTPTTTIPTRITPGVALTSSGYTGGVITNGATWCFALTNDSQTVVYSDRGYQEDDTICEANGVTWAGSALLNANRATGSDADGNTVGFITAGPTLTSTTEAAHQGTRSVRMSVVGGGVDRLSAGIVDVPVQQNTSYTATVQVRGAAAENDGVSLIYRWYGSGGGTIGYSSAGPAVTLSPTGWTQISHTATSPAGATGAGVYIYRSPLNTVARDYYMDTWTFTQN